MIKILQLSAIKNATAAISATGCTSATVLTIAIAITPSPLLAGTTTNPVKTATTTADVEAPKLSVVERMRGITQLNYKKWSIRSGCINSSRIRRIKFLDDSTALLSLVGKKKAVLKLASRCPGIKKNGFSYASDGQRLCTRHTRFSVLGGSYACKVASIDPYLELEDPSELQEYD